LDPKPDPNTEYENSTAKTDPNGALLFAIPINRIER